MPNKGFSRRLYSMHAAHPQPANGALEDPTALPQRPLSAMSNTLCKRQAAAFVLSMSKMNAAAWRWRRLRSVFTAFPQRWWHMHSTHLSNLQLFWTLWKRCLDAPLVWLGFNVWLIELASVNAVVTRLGHSHILGIVYINALVSIA